MDRLAPDDFRTLERQLQHDPDFNPNFNLLTDISAVTAFDGSIEDAKQIATRTMFSPESRRAVVTNKPHIFGLARMMHVYRENADLGHDNGVFHDLSSALKWLGVELGS
jgi:hypothetical protein